MAREYHEIEFISVERITEHAILFDTEDDGIVWVPKSQIAPEDRLQYKEGDGTGSVMVTEWWARKRGLV